LLVVVTDRPADLRALEQRDQLRRGAGPAVRHRVHRFDFLLHPRERPSAEPVFRTDLRPELSVRLSPPRPSAWQPGRSALRLTVADGPEPDGVHVVVVAPAGDGVRVVRRSVGAGRSATLIDDVLDGAVEVAVFAGAARLGDGETTLAGVGPVDAMAGLVWQVVAEQPAAVPLLRATLPAVDVPATVRTDRLTLDLG
jgi:hypothetical protein